MRCRRPLRFSAPTAIPFSAFAHFANRASLHKSLPRWHGLVGVAVVALEKKYVLARVSTVQPLTTRATRLTWTADVSETWNHVRHCTAFAPWHRERHQGAELG